jgi:hypothetical protein
MVDRGLADPRRRYPTQDKLDQCFRDLTKEWQDEDPAPQPEHALPNSTVKWLGTHFGTSLFKRERIIADLVVVAFFFLLRICEYTKSSRRTRTVPLRRKDIQLWHKNRLLPHSTPLHQLLQADAVTINLENQKNGQRGAIVHHHSSGNAHFDPVRSMARLIYEIQSMPDTTPIGTFRTPTNTTDQIRPNEVVEAIRYAAGEDGLPAAGFNIARIGSHSLRSGGAVNLHLNGYDHGTIKKLGRWSGKTYLRYIQNSVGELTTGISHRMATTLRFHHVGS